MASQPRLAQLAGKRGLGFINWQRKRKNIHRPEILDAITRDLKTCPLDHIAVTGDLVNLSLPDEYARARQWLETIGRPADVTVVPGNHDVYVRGVEQAPAKFWGDYMRGDDGLRSLSVRAAARRRCADRALDRTADGAVPGDRLARQQAALAVRRRARSNPRLVPRRAHPSSAGKPAAAFSAASDRRCGFAPRAGGKGRRAFAAWPRSSLVARLARWAGGKKIPAVGVPSASASAPHGERRRGRL